MTPNKSKTEEILWKEKDRHKIIFQTLQIPDILIIKIFHYFLELLKMGSRIFCIFQLNKTKLYKFPNILAGKEMHPIILKCTNFYFDISNLISINVS